MNKLAFRNWPFWVKIGLAPAVGLVVLITVCAAGIITLKAQQKVTDTLINQAIASEIDMLMIAERLQSVNASLFELATKQAAEAFGADDEARLAGLPGDIASINEKLNLYKETYDPNGEDSRLTTMAESLVTYKDAVDFLGSMLLLDFNSAVSFVLPFQDNLKTIRADMQALMDDADKKAKTKTQEMQHQASQVQSTYLWAALFATIIVCLLTTYTALATTRGIKSLAEVTNALAHGDNDVDLEAHTRADALGDVVQSLKVFRKNQIEVQRLGEEKKKADEEAAIARERHLQEKAEADRVAAEAREQQVREKAEADLLKAKADREAAAAREQHLKEQERERARQQQERAVMMNELKEAIGDVVDAVAAGDFTRRVDANFNVPELNELATGLNRLVDTVQAGLDETKLVLNGLAQSDLTLRMNGQYEGDFARLQADVNKTGESLSAVVNNLQVSAMSMRGAHALLVRGTTPTLNRNNFKLGALTVE